MLDSTGTPLVTFTRNTASNGFISPVCETFRRPNKSFNEFSLHTNSTAAWVPRVVVPGIVQREQATTLDPNLPVQRCEYPIEIMYRQHFSHSGVMVENQVTRVARRIEIAHSRFRAPNESPIAENDPRLLRAGEKSTPERSKHRRGRLNVRCGPDFGFVPRFHQDRDNRQCRGQKHRERSNGPAHFRLRLRRDFWTELPHRGMRTLMKRENVSPLRQLHNNGIIRAFRAVVLRQLHAQPARLHADRRIRLRIEIRWPAENFSRNLIFFQRYARMMEGMLGQVPKQLAERFRSVQDMTADQAFDLNEKLFSLGYRGAMIACHTHLTRG